jgi:hypothetical protein
MKSKGFTPVPTTDAVIITEKTTSVKENVFKFIDSNFTPIILAGICIGIFLIIFGSMMQGKQPDSPITLPLIIIGSVFIGLSCVCVAIKQLCIK